MFEIGDNVKVICTSPAVYRDKQGTVYEITLQETRVSFMNSEFTLTILDNAYANEDDDHCHLVWFANNELTLI
ncbi:hypothetical protein LCGC14_1395630 [marine sediment metagenome]|uniref:Uncharacterized protein n=1 Tax=marine sediment metagenome TaxID=412755 RepID=A0A0F9KJK6_9ZZZZ